MQVISTKGVDFQGGYPLAKGVLGASRLNMITESDRHLQRGTGGVDAEGSFSTFGEALNNALSGVEAIDNKAKQLTTKAVIDPDSVNAHEVVIAAEKARFALNLTKTVADGLVRTFKELSNPR